MATEFVGKGTPLSQQGIDTAAASVGVGAAEIWAVLTVETTGCGFLPDRRPKILFERHIFHRETNGRFDTTAPDLSDRTSGGYGSGGAHQYDRLARAIAHDRHAALRSASWGIGQVMGFNAESVGFPSVEQMVLEMAESEDAQLRGMLEFVRSNGLHRAMQEHDWRTFARRYNGPDFEKNAYDTKLDQAFTRLSTGGLPDLRVRAAQILLTYRAIDPGPIDGQNGNRTRTALRTFQERAGLAATGEPDEPTMTALAA
jgi:N-acetylmuramidase/Putative peptidoglycan binding domain